MPEWFPDCRRICLSWWFTVAEGCHAGGKEGLHPAAAAADMATRSKENSQQSGGVQRRFDFQKPGMYSRMTVLPGQDYSHSRYPEHQHGMGHAPRNETEEAPFMGRMRNGFGSRACDGHFRQFLFNGKRALKNVSFFGEHDSMIEARESKSASGNG